MLKVKNLSVRFGETRVLDDLSFEITKGDVVAIIGPNGAGKTVLFRSLLGLVPHEGSIEWPKNIKIGYVPQKLSVSKDLPVTVAEFLGLKNVPHEEAYEALESVGLIKQPHRDTESHQAHHLHEHLLNLRLGHLSGGELQRILIAYALMGHPDILLFDEPTAGIDIGGEETIYSLLEKLHKEQGLTILLISHDLNIIYRYAKKVICLNKERICYGSPKEALTPEALQKLYGTKIGVYKHEHTK